MAGFNHDIELLAIGPVDPREIKETIQQIREEGANFVNAPSVDLDWPLFTMGRDVMRKQMEDIVDAVEDCDDGG